MDAGTKFSERSLLEYSIVLTGATLVLSDIVAVGLSGVGFIVCQMALTITAAYLIGRRFGFGRRFCLLMGAGNAVCGSSAIATVSPVVGADSKDKGISITIVNVTGTVLMVLLPVITGLVYNHAMLPTTAMIGGVMQSIGQVIASAGLVGPEFVPDATIFKIIRIVFIVFVALAFSRLNPEEEGSLFAGGKAAGRREGRCALVHHRLLHHGGAEHPGRGARAGERGGQVRQRPVRDHRPGGHRHAGQVPGPGQGGSPGFGLRPVGGRVPGAVRPGPHPAVPSVSSL